MRKVKKIIVSILLATFILASFSTMVLAAPSPTTRVTDYGYGVVITEKTYYFDSKFDALVAIDALDSPSYSSAIEYLVSLGIGFAHPAFGVIYALGTTLINGANSAMLDMARDFLLSQTSQHITLTFCHMENPRAHGYTQDWIQVGTW